MKHGLTAGELQILRENLREYAGKIKKVGIYGSRANGQYKEYSDIDLVVYGDVDQQAVNRLNTLFDESNLGVRVDISAYHLITYPPLKRHIDSAGKTLFTAKQLNS